MVEVFKTNVNSLCHAWLLVFRIEQAFREYSVNFDLEDCDRILRVKSSSGPVQPLPLIELLERHGYEAAVLPDEFPAVKPELVHSFAGNLHG